MKQYKAQTFDIPTIEGISDSQIQEHLKLYNGYVTHVNKINELIHGWRADGGEENDYAVSELWRRLGFEFNGMRSHEYYFGALEHGPKPFDPKSDIGKAIIEQYGSFDEWKDWFSQVGKTRGSGWAMLYYDKTIGEFLSGWIDEHHIGYLSSLPVVLALDCWEHAYMVDYLPSERGTYIDAYLSAVNWNTVAQWFDTITS